MRIADSRTARIDLAVAKARVIAVAEELKTTADPELCFGLIWKLAFVDLKNLEEHRVPK